MDFNSEADCRSENQQHFHVLAVDDSLIDRKLLERLLTVSSYQVTCVESGDKALEYLGLLDMEESEYDTSSSTSSTSSQKSSQQDQQVSKVNLIMTDYSMPGITGYDLLKRVKDSSWKDIPVVVMSSENVPSRINMCLEGGAEEFLLKPVQLSDLKKLHSNLLINSVITHDHLTYDDATNIIDDDLSTCSTTDEMTNSDSNEEETTDENCSNSNKRKAASTSSSDLSDMRPRVKELPVS